MRTRDDLQQEAKELVRTISLYGSLQFEQVLALFPGRADSIRNLISRLLKQKRLYYAADSGQLSIMPDVKPNPSVISAFWVLLDFMEKVCYHSSSDFPVSISFFTEDDAFEIVVVQAGQENLINHALWYTNGKDPAKRIVVVESTDQISELNIQNVAGFCTVDFGGEVSYFHIDQEVSHE